MPADPSLDHLIRPLEERLGDRQAEGLGGLEVDDQLELGGLLDREIARLRVLEDLVHVGRGAAPSYLDGSKKTLSFYPGVGRSSMVVAHHPERPEGLGG